MLRIFSLIEVTRNILHRVRNCASWTTNQLDIVIPVVRTTQDSHRKWSMIRTRGIRDNLSLDYRFVMPAGFRWWLRNRLTQNTPQSSMWLIVIARVSHSLIRLSHIHCECNINSESERERERERERRKKHAFYNKPRMNQYY